MIVPVVVPVIVVMSVIVTVVVVMIVPVVVPVIVVMSVIVGHTLPVGMGRHVIVVVDVFVGVLLYDAVDRVFFNCVFMLHNAASFCKGTDCCVFRAAADFFQIFDFVCHILSPFLAPELRVRGACLTSFFAVPGP
jgi:hypothetical protein